MGRPKQIKNQNRKARTSFTFLPGGSKGKPMMKEAIVDVSKGAIEETMTKTMLSTKLALDLVILMEDVGGEPPEQPQGNEGGEKGLLPPSVVSGASSWLHKEGARALLPVDLSSGTRPA